MLKMMRKKSSSVILIVTLSCILIVLQIIQESKNINSFRSENKNDDDEPPILYPTTKATTITSKNEPATTEEKKENFAANINNEDNDDDTDDDNSSNNIAIKPTTALTGSFTNCTSNNSVNYQDHHHKDSGTVIASCRVIEYRVPLQSFTIATPIIVGILSEAGNNGPTRRQTIRDTWASGKKGIFFLVAGPWDEDIQMEYDTFGDLIWINEEEVYTKEHSVLQMKTMSFLSIVHQISDKKVSTQYSYVLKTDDDSYVNLDALWKELSSSNTTTSIEYWGHCSVDNRPEPNRGKEFKWSVSMQEYPEPFYPYYCQGAGYALSKDFLDCAASQHISKLQSMPFEDVAVGMLAERCQKQATSSTDTVKLHRYTSKLAKERIRFDIAIKDDLPPPPPPCMTGKIIQHRIIDEQDMKQHHQTVLDPSICS